MNFINIIKKNKTFISVTLSFFVVLELISYLYVNYLTDAAIKFLNVKNATIFEQHIKFANNHLISNAKIFYDREIDIPKMEDIMQEATVASEQGNEKQLASLREELYTLFLPTYNYMRKKSVRQLHFHLPSAVSFLRFHRPQKFGDSLLGVRKALKYVNEKQKTIHVFEEGRIFNGFRNIYPIFKDSVFVGTVEVSYSFTALQSAVQKVDKSSLLFLVKNDLVTTNVFEDEQTNYKKSEFLSFSYDRKTFQDQKELSKEQIKYINKSIKEKVDWKLKQKEKFAVLFNDESIFNGNYISIEFLPIVNIDNEKVAYIVRYEDDTTVDTILSRHKALLATFSLLSILVSMSVGLLLQRAKKEEDKVRRIATYDALTKIYNRYGLKYVLENTIGDFTSYKKNLSVIFFDIDHFKHVNDTHGHDVGDDVLENLTALVSKHIRISDIFARWGGEEFIIVLPETSLSSATKLAEKLRSIVQEYDFETPKHITCSFGVAQLHKKETETKLLKRVDELLYIAKDSGRNCVISESIS